MALFGLFEPIEKKRDVQKRTIDVLLWTHEKDVFSAAAIRPSVFANPWNADFQYRLLRHIQLLNQLPRNALQRNF